ncbi:FMN-binding protein [bacterium]|nr:FMN-binding protein [bacterium]
MSDMEQQMPQQQVVPQDDSPSPLRLIMTMAGIGLASGILIVATFQLTLPFIVANKEAALEAAIVEVLPGATSQHPFAEVDGKLEPTTMDAPVQKKFYVGYDDDGEVVGVAIQTAGQGFQDTISLIYGYSPSKHAIIGFKVLESKETPGLGDKIISDPAFLSNFNELAIPLTDDGSAVKEKVKLVKNGEKTQPWEMEAITGATISSRAVATILGTDTESTVPVIERSVDILKKGADDVSE